MTSIIQATGLTKTFGDFTAVDHVNLDVRPGEIYGFLGPNGAGKTTTIMMLLGMHPPTTGEVRLFGNHAYRNPAVKKRIGVALENLSFYDEMTALEYLRFFGQIYAVEDVDRRATDLLERLQLADWKDGVIGSFSTGMRRKLALSRTLLHNPELLILDEPISGLDPFSIVQVRELLLEANRNGTTIFISSHHLSEVEQTAHRIGIIARGRLVAEDTVANLQQRIRPAHAHITVELADVPDGLPHQLEQQPFVERVSQDGNRLTVFTDDPAAHRVELSRFLSAQGALIVDMQATTSTLEEAFITLTSSHIDQLQT